MSWITHRNGYGIDRRNVCLLQAARICPSTSSNVLTRDFNLLLLVEPLARSYITWQVRTSYPSAPPRTVSAIIDCCTVEWVCVANARTPLNALNRELNHASSSERICQSIRRRPEPPRYFMSCIQLNSITEAAITGHTSLGSVRTSVHLGWVRTPESLSLSNGMLLLILGQHRWSSNAR